MMFALRRLLTFTILSVAVVEARFGQENSVQGIIAAIGGNNGQAATLAGQSISTLLAGSNACDKLTLADKVAALDGAGALDAAKALVQAEKNFNPFAVDKPSICDDASLPKTEALRGILPLIDPAVDGAAAINTASKASLTNPLNQDGISQAGLLTAQGFTTFTAQSSTGQVTTPAPANGGNNNTGGNDNANNDNANNEDTANDGTNTQCPSTSSSTGGASTTANLQTFTGTLGAAPDPIIFSGDAKRPFSVAGTTFVNFAAAATRSCDRQFNACANAANKGSADIAVGDCTAQKTACQNAQNSAQTKSFARRRRRRGAAKRSNKRRAERNVKRARRAATTAQTARV